MFYFLFSCLNNMLCSHLSLTRNRKTHHIKQKKRRKTHHGSKFVGLQITKLHVFINSCGWFFFWQHFLVVDGFTQKMGFGLNAVGNMWSCIVCKFGVIWLRSSSLDFMSSFLFFLIKNLIFKFEPFNQDQMVLSFLTVRLHAVSTTQNPNPKICS